MLKYKKATKKIYKKINGKLVLFVYNAQKRF